MLRSRMFLLVGLAALAAVVLVGCGSQSGNAKALEAHEWKVAKLGSAAYSGSADITAVFSAGKLNGSTGINSYNGSYEAAKGNDISISLGAMTQRAGTPEAMKAESDYLKALSTAVSYAVDEQSLTLFDSSGNAVVAYIVEVPTPLVGTTWVMTAYNNGRGGFQSADSSGNVTAVFAQDGTLSGNGGVNNYSSTYTASGSTISIKPIVSTKMAGPEDLMTQEEAYFAALQKASKFAVEGDRLTLRDATGAAMAEYVAK